MTNLNMNETVYRDVTLNDAIFNRRSIRDFKDKKVGRDIIYSLIEAAVRAPSAMAEEPWAFVVIEDKKFLHKISEFAKVLMEEEALKNPDKKQVQYDLDILRKPNFNIFYNAQTLVVIYSKFPGPFVSADCWLAAQNIMLSAYANGLGSCAIALALNPLNSPDLKKELGISEDMIAIAPIIIGWPADNSPEREHLSPEIYFYDKK